MSEIPGTSAAARIFTPSGADASDSESEGGLEFAEVVSSLEGQPSVEKPPATANLAASLGRNMPAHGSELPPDPAMLNSLLDPQTRVEELSTQANPGSELGSLTGGVVTVALADGSAGNAVLSTHEDAADRRQKLNLSLQPVNVSNAMHGSHGDELGDSGLDNYSSRISASNVLGVAAMPATQNASLAPTAAIDAQALENSNKLNGAALVQEGSTTIATTPLQSAAASTSASLPASVETSLSLNHPRFAEGISQQVVMLVKDGVQFARISINPPELGPVELRIVMRGDDAAVQLASQHGAVRDALEEALPRLREQFQQQGMNLADGSVHQQLPQEDNLDDETKLNRALANETPIISEETLDVSQAARRGLIDAYI